MRLEDQVCALELSKQLKELGVKQQSLFYWWQPKDVITNHHILIYERDITVKEYAENKHISAFTVAELGMILPLGRWTEEKTMGGFRIWFIEDSGKDHHTFAYDENEANARAKMLIYLIENNIEH